MAKIVNFGDFLKPQTCGQTVLPDRSFYRSKIGGKCQKLKCDILSNFQTMCGHKNKYSRIVFTETKL